MPIPHQYLSFPRVLSLSPGPKMYFSDVFCPFSITSFVTSFDPSPLLTVVVLVVTVLPFLNRNKLTLSLWWC